MPCGWKMVRRFWARLGAWRPCSPLEASYSWRRIAIDTVANQDSLAPA